MSKEQLPVRMAKNPEGKYHDLELTEYPFTRGKIIRFKDQSRAEDYRAQSITKSYVVLQVPGYNIFISFAGFCEKPTAFITNVEIKKHIIWMCNWYMLNVLYRNQILQTEYGLKQEVYF